MSLARARSARDWLEAQRLLESQETIEKEVIGANKGGLIVPVGQLRGFVPGSQLATLRPAGPAGRTSAAEERWASLVGHTILVKVIEVDQQRNRLILSERAAVREGPKSHREQLLHELTAGDVRRVCVVNLAAFGAFVDLGGLDGLVHLSELSWERVQHPSEVLEIGQEVEVIVLSVNCERQRVALSIKRLQPDPWTSVNERYQVGQLVEGVITRLTKWGAFVSIKGDEAIEGLVHISELAEAPVGHPRDVIQPDQVVTLRVIGVDVVHHRLSLSLRQASGGVSGPEECRATQPDPSVFDRSREAHSESGAP